MLRRLLLFILTSAASATTLAAQWNFIGYSKNGVHESFEFFDSETIAHPANSIVRVWMKSIRRTDIDAHWKRHQKELIDEAALRITTGRIPRFLTIESNRRKYATESLLQDAVIDLTRYELSANSPALRSVMKVYYEIDCAGRRIKALEGVTYRANGDVAAASKAPADDYHFVVPDSTGQWLTEIACVQR
jgi:hypothetical protein